MWKTWHEYRRSDLQPQLFHPTYYKVNCFTEWTEFDDVFWKPLCFSPAIPLKCSFLINLPFPLVAHYANLIISKSLLILFLVIMTHCQLYKSSIQSKSELHSLIPFKSSFFSTTQDWHGSKASWEKGHFDFPFIFLHPSLPLFLASSWS